MKKCISCGIHIPEIYVSPEIEKQFESVFLAGDPAAKHPQTFDGLIDALNNALPRVHDFSFKVSGNTCTIFDAIKEYISFEFKHEGNTLYLIDGFMVRRAVYSDYSCNEINSIFLLYLISEILHDTGKQ
jgi:hypothetical protein